jgi:lysozyme
MTAAQLAFSLIRVFEGLRLKAYCDPTGKVWTCGFGHVQGVTATTVCTVAQAMSWFEEDSAPLLAKVANKPTLEAAALVSFGYNCGIGALERVLSGSISISDNEFVTDNLPYGESSGGTVLAGLVARRQLEASLIEVSRAS